MMKKPLTSEEAMLRMASLCARSEQCEADVKLKLRRYGLSADEIAEVIKELKEGKFIDLRRYARSFARDKVRFSAWGRRKIRMALLAKQIPEIVIEEAFREIEPADYEDAVDRSARARASSLDLSIREDRAKLYRHLLGRGFESDIVMEAIRRLTR